MLPTVAVAHDGARALLLLTLASTAHSGDCRPPPPAFRALPAASLLELAPCAHVVLAMDVILWCVAVRVVWSLGHCAGLEDPCKYTPDGFERPRSPCGANGICSVTSTWSELVPHQRTFNCTCVGNYVGDRCEKCAHGYTFRSGCEGAVSAAAAIPVPFC